VIGAVDVGGTKVAVGVADAQGRLLAQDRFPTRPERGPDAVIAEIADRLRALGHPFTTVGVGCVGPLDLDEGLILSPPNFPGWDRVPLRRALEARLGLPVVIDNDANAAALAEYKLGAGQGAKILVYATVSTGIGGGILVDGKLVHGVGGGAGEFGHQTLVPDGPRCGCGNHGCLEALASGPAIVAAARKAGFERPDMHAGHVAEAAAAGDPIAGKVWEDAVEVLAIGLGNVITTLAPDRVVIGGGVAQAGDLLLRPLREALARRVRMVPMDRVDVRLAAHGADAGIFGAIAVGLPRA
jgi:glucokinase